MKRSTVWFPAKRYGWGWGLPCAWQGWVVFLAYLALVTAACIVIDPASHQKTWLVTIVGLSLLLCLVCWSKGEKPAWRWGDKKQ